MADDKVLEAQKWVNSTYGGVSGYSRCPEDGRTGWSTMYSLVMGLQHELGISPVVASFGPTTEARLAALGDIGFGWNKNANIVRIIQHGLFCKGYWGANGYGEFGAVTTEAVKAMRVDMGLPDGGVGIEGGTVTPKIFKCILNMDAYVIVAGGTDKIRNIQRWLNGRYWQRSAYSIGPAEGIYSRDVQKSLMIALQYELGLEPNGNYGPGTQAGLRSHPVREGDSGIFVELFTAACVFNEPVIMRGLDDTEVRTTFKSSFDSKTKEFVQIFQEFSQLYRSEDSNYGVGDFDTWSQLLVSTGNTAREATGSDTRFEITASRARWLYDNDYRLVGRYLYDPPGSTLDKEIKPGELQTIFAAGLRVFPIYQDNARQLSDFTYSHGYQHALNAHDLASDYGFNRGTTIYFAVDYDAQQGEIDSTPQGIIAYFNGVVAGLASRGKKYFHGVYGSRNVCINVTKRTGARYSFVSGMSWGFSGNLGFPLPSNWAINQIKEFKVTNGSDVFDLDRDVWRRNSEPGSNSVNKQSGPADAYIAYVRRLYNLAVAYKAAKNVDTNASRLVMEYIRHEKYEGLSWWWLAGSYDSGFVQYCNDANEQVEDTFTDTVTGYSLDATHLMATANGFLVNSDPDNKGDATGGDVAGWGGDIMTFWADWRNSEEQYASPLTFCQAKLAIPGTVSSFGFTDMIEDVDGYLLAKHVAGGGNIVDWMTSHYNGGGALTRFRSHFDRRWQTASNAKSSCSKLLYGAVDSKISPARFALITGAGAVLPGDYILIPGNGAKFDDFCQGFTDRQLSLIGLENSRAAQYRKNLQTYREQAALRASAR
ncbi:MAG TPA: glycoside hydrolase domain-containing protein [Streptomyces sp.]|uniref:glycoside hydrolase domain-containing protein n=1 Tax=Streptomyces sp. TaxID=1931 RepID=UPI002B9FB011|nr:glycoside hydrolase domain-containing protein [Streptomyces sp.]HWU09589.1 glycoside hydrolase domain-containing protein [Streptomyces sp.]